jgi:hypothetical protein
MPVSSRITYVKYQEDRGVNILEENFMKKDWSFAYNNLVRDFNTLLEQIPEIEAGQLHKYNETETVLVDLQKSVAVLNEYLEQIGSPRDLEGKMHKMAVTRLRDDENGFVTHFEEEVNLTGQHIPTELECC